MSWDEIALLAKELEKAGASIISTHFVWHEANVPTIATMVPELRLLVSQRGSEKKSASLSSPLIGLTCRKWPRKCWKGGRRSCVDGAPHVG